MKISNFNLDNGINCLAIHDEDCPSVTTTILVKTGSRYETDHESGIAHLIEHMIFKGTKLRANSKIIANDVELMGGHMNAFTSQEYTGFYLKAPKQNFLKVLDVLSDIFKNSIFPENELVKEKSVIYEEIKMYEDIPMEKVNDQFLEKLFLDHPLGKNIAGTKESLEKISRQDCLDFIDKYYTDKNIVIVVAGGFSFEGLQNSLNELFKGKDHKKEITFQLATPRELNNKYFEFTKKIEQSHIVMGGFLGARNSESRIPLLLGDVILSGGFGSKLFQRIREDLGLAYYIGLGINQFKDIGYYSINMGVDPSKKQLAIDNVNIEVNKFLKGDIDTIELERAKNYLIGNLSTNLETSEELANWYGIRFLLDGEIQYLDDFIRKIEKTGVDVILEQWNKYLKPENLLTVCLNGKN